MAQNISLKKVNLIPGSLQLMKKLKVFQIIAIIVSACIVLSFSGFCVFKVISVKKTEAQIEEMNTIISEARFSELEELRERYELLSSQSQSGQNNVIPNINGLDMTDFLTYIMKHMPAGTKLESIDGQLSNSAEYGYSFNFTSSQRNTIAKFLSDLQNEPNLKNINISAITNNGSTSQEITDVNNTVQKTNNGNWSFTLSIKAKADSQNSGGVS